MGKRKFCDRRCVREAYHRGMIRNPGLFKPGGVSPNKGRTLESWVGAERAREIKAKMSASSLKKISQLRKLNEDPQIVARRLESRAFHDRVVQWLGEELRHRGCRVFTLSEYIKEKRIPDAIVFFQGKLVAVEVETEKRWKPSHTAIEDRLRRLNGLCHFFDKTKVVFPGKDDSLDEVGPSFVTHILSHKD
jgi:hypothetical protein